MGCWGGESKAQVAPLFSWQCITQMITNGSTSWHYATFTPWHVFTHIFLHAIRDLSWRIYTYPEHSPQAMPQDLRGDWPSLSGHVVGPLLSWAHEASSQARHCERLQVLQWLERQGGRGLLVARITMVSPDWIGTYSRYDITHPQQMGLLP